MVMARWTQTVQDAAGNGVAGCQIEVRREDTGQLVSVYGDRAGTALLGNPFTAQGGTFFFHVVGGSYKITATKAGFQSVWRYVAIGTAAEYDADALRGSAFGYSVLDFGAEADDVTDDGPAFAAAQAAAIAGGSKLVVVPQGNYLIDTQVDLAADVMWLFLGARLRTSLDTMTILSADTVHGWAILGDVRLIGSLILAEETAQVGLQIKDCDRFRVEGVTALNLKGQGFRLTGTSSIAPLRGDRGQFTSCAAYDCTVGRQLDAGAGAEYTTWTNWHASGCAKADIIGAGNTVTNGFSIVDNDVGVELVGGSNHGHGIYSGGNINHNTVNLTAADVTYGFTFDGCHIYEGSLEFDNCDGIRFDGGIIDVASVVNTSGDESGALYLRNMWWDDSYGPVAFTGTAAHQVVVQNASGPGRPNRNTTFPVEVHAYRNKGSTQALSSGAAATVLFTGEAQDNSDAFNPGTGVFTVPQGQAGVYEFSWTIVCGGTGLSNASFCELQVDNDGGGDGYTSQVISGPSLYSTTLMTFQGSGALSCAEGAQARLRATVAGTSPVVGHSSWYCLLSIKKIGG